MGESTKNERALLLKVLYTGRDYVSDILALEKQIYDKDAEITAHENWGTVRKTAEFYFNKSGTVFLSALAAVILFVPLMGILSVTPGIAGSEITGSAFLYLPFVGIVDLLICICLYHLFCQIRMISIRKKVKAFTVEWETSGVQKLDELNRQKRELLARKKDLVRNQARETLSLLPPKYIYLEAIDFFIDVITNMRADSIKEAANLYEEHLYRQRMEAAQQKLVEQQARALQLQRENQAVLNSIQQSAQRTEDSSRQTADSIHTLEELAVIQYLRK